MVTITTRPSFTFSSPAHVKARFLENGPIFVRSFDILPDGKRFLGMVTPGQTQAGPLAAPIQVVLNWFEEVKQRVPGR